jgi:selenide,water dikinase
MVACDPQTSGGLLLCVPAGEIEAVLAELRAYGPTAESAWIGEVTAPRESVGCIWLA